MLPGEHTPSPVQLPQVQLFEHVSVPQLPHDVIVPGAHEPWPVQLPQVQLFEHVSVPQLPHDVVVPGEHEPWPVQLPALHLQLDEQVSISDPQLPQETVRVAPGVQEPQAKVPPQPSGVGPQSCAAQVFGVQHVPLHTWPLLQVLPQSSVPPQPSLILPHCPLVQLEIGEQQVPL